MEFAQSFSSANQAYASDNPHQIVYTNSIESLNVITLYDFDVDHPAGSNVNDILLLLDSMGVTTQTEINKLSSTDHFYKFSPIPQNDSLQFEVSGIITDEGEFTVKTELVIINGSK